MRSLTSSARPVAIPGPVTTNASCTKAGEVKLRIPKLRVQTFETAIIERYRRRESSVEEALIEMYLVGVSIEAWRNRPIDGEHPYVYLDGIVLKRGWAGEVRNVSLLVAIGVNSGGYREFSASAKEPRRTRRAGAPSSNTSRAVA
jgi:putative transposase